MKKHFYLLLLFAAILGSCKKDSDITPDTDTSPSQESSPLYIIKQNGKYGYINKEGKVVIPAKFDWTLGFSEDLAAVELNGTLGFIDKEGNMKLSLPYEYVTNFSEGRAMVHDGSKSGYIDKNGKAIIGLQYPSVSYFFSEGYIQVYSPTLSQEVFLDKDGKVAFNRGFDVINQFSEGLAYVRLDYTTWKLIDTKGNLISCEPCKDEDIFAYTHFSHGLMAISNNNAHTTYQKGYIDKSGKLIIPFKFEHALPFSEGLAAVRMNGKWGFINTSGTTVIHPSFDDIAENSGSPLGETPDGGIGQGFSEGLAAVRVEGKWGYIDKAGTLVVPAVFDNAKDFYNGLAAVYKSNQGWGYIDKKGTYIWNPSK